MLKPQLPNIPGAGVVGDTLDFVKNLWGSMGVPGANLASVATPTLSVEELDKKITDLKAVESWLNVNTSMVRGTIQALEVQRGTLAALKSMGAALSNAVKQPGADEKSILQAAPFASVFFPPAEDKAVKAEKAQAKPAPEPKAEKEPPASPTPDDHRLAPPPDQPPGMAAMANAGAWWGLLQDQFKQAVNTAMSTDAAGKIAAAGAGTAAELTKAVGKTLSRAAAPAPKPAAAKKAAAKRSVAKPRARKPSE
ncbi:MAG: PhaM family polyhydroxyalkanoate granule multifunctional regulatory protein [Telluria sp.]